MARSEDFEEKVLGALNTLQQDVSGLKDDVSGLKQSVHRLELLHEATEEKIDQIIEAVSPEMEKLNNIEGHVEHLEESDKSQNIRLNSLERAA